MKVKNILYIIFMVLFMILAYLLCDRGFNAKTKVYVTYQEKSDVTYKVYLHDNSIYDNEYLGLNERYITKLVDHIDVNFVYDILFNRDLSGYYTYTVTGNLVGYTDDINDSLFTKEEELLNKTVTLNQNNVKDIKIDEDIVIDYDKYTDELWEEGSLILLSKLKKELLQTPLFSHISPKQIVFSGNGSNKLLIKFAEKIFSVHKARLAVFKQLISKLKV